MVYQALIFTPWIIALIIWSAIWKYIALWKAGRNNQLAWFVVIAIVNTAGILEIIYLLFFRKNMNRRINTQQAPVKKVSRRKK
ncbi:MAG: DUF5652 family protein [Nanoarchaeota archaeon]